ncbi:ABC-F family ATP-binding cassette domain-containing protein [Moraxella sp. VT-16-12]|uniref:ABC-F family ATP-binding cassette domain-containing protein n=1 Tax=Moraxella sp. VT-16-12 TaxID=2014877 RepID=UPI000B7C6912|nr:ATP-binding cassette domain-containing protein [Moraxella sp. VT-16-12]TWV80797.1 ATP-binding cassette domain-containing protein [Moraxella sp. VT-16-12]
MIELKNVAVRRDGRLLFSGVDLQFHKGQTIGLTGNNGTGKSTLFATLLGEHATDIGTISMPKDWQIAHMAQEIHTTDQSALDYVLSGDDEWYQLNDKLSNQHTLAQTDIAPLYQRFDEIDGYRTVSRASQILSGLGFGEHEHQKMVHEFSGGWRMRLNLARTLMHRADVLLLDEPTNHLDLDAILWLEEWLVKFDGLILVISHDQAFMDTICSHIAHIEQQTITLYTGNYAQFIRTRAERLAQQAQAYERQEAIKAHLENFIRRFGAKATKAKQAQSRVKQLANMTNIAPVMAQSEFSFKFYPPTALSSPLISLDNAYIGYGDTTLINKVNLQITPDTRLGILGANGAGKSTLIKALVGHLPPLSGTHKVSDNLKLGYFNQHQMDALDDTATPLILLRRLAGTTSDADLRAFLGSFNFKGDKIDTPCQLFSGGERARLTLALIVWGRPNVLVLDEPTNHLDLSMRNALMLALQDYEGALILVSHDRDLVMTVCDSLLLVANGRADEFAGDMTDYAEHLRQARLAKFAQNKTTTDNPTKDTLTKEKLRKRNAENRQKTAPLRKQIDKLEKTLDTLTKELSDIELSLSDQSLYHDDNKAKLLSLLDRQSTHQKQMDDIENELLEKMDELETLMADLGDDS